jgi:hypothetical protein
VIRRLLRAGCLPWMGRVHLNRPKLLIAVSMLISHICGGICSYIYASRLIHKINFF